MNEALAELISGQTARAEAGERPGMEDPEGQAEWDRIKRRYYGNMGIVNKPTLSYLPDFLRDLFPGGGLQSKRQTPEGFGADTTGTAEPTEPDATKVKKVSSGEGKPTFRDPVASKAVEGALRLTRDSSLFRTNPDTRAR